MKLKKDCVVLWGGRQKVLKAGVEYKNLPKEVTAQLPKTRGTAKAKTAKKTASKKARSD